VDESKVLRVLCAASLQRAIDSAIGGERRDPIGGRCLRPNNTLDPAAAGDPAQSGFTPFFSSKHTGWLEFICFTRRRDLHLRRAH